MESRTGGRKKEKRKVSQGIIPILQEKKKKKRWISGFLDFSQSPVPPSHLSSPTQGKRFRKTNVIATSSKINWSINTVSWFLSVIDKELQQTMTLLLLLGQKCYLKKSLICHLVADLFFSFLFKQVWDFPKHLLYFRCWAVILMLNTAYYPLFWQRMQHIHTPHPSLYSNLYWLLARGNNPPHLPPPHPDWLAGKAT